MWLMVCITFSPIILYLVISLQFQWLLLVWQWIDKSIRDPFGRNSNYHYSQCFVFIIFLLWMQISLGFNWDNNSRFLCYVVKIIWNRKTKSSKQFNVKHYWNGKNGVGSYLQTGWNSQAVCVWAFNIFTSFFL